MTVDAQKIMSCVIKTGQRYGKRMIADVLRGKYTKRISEEGLEAQSTYGAMADYTKQEVYDIIDGLVRQGYMESTLDQYSILKVLPKSYSVLHGEEAVFVKMAKEQKRSHTNKNLPDVDNKLLSSLKLLRKSFAQKASVPAFVVFSDATLVDMSRRKPTTKDEFLEVSGVGEVKYKRYGEAFIEVIKKFK